MTPHPAVRPLLRIAAALLTLAVPVARAAESADDAALRHARGLAATCAQCHGSDGATPPGSAMRTLIGMPASYLTQQMLAFRSGERPGTVMPQLAKGYSDAQIAQIAGYFAALAPAAAR
jgi:cytochrome c553